MTKQNYKINVERRIILVCVLLIFFAITVVGRVGYVNFHYDPTIINTRIKTDTIFGPRGDILADDSSLLSTTLTSFDAFIDINTSSITEAIFKKNMDSLAYKLDSLFAYRENQKSFKELLLKARANKKDHYAALVKNLTHAEMRALKSFPIFRNGQYKGGLIIEPINNRKQPFKSLARRTIGYDKIVKSAKDSTVERKLIGLEGFYNDYLEGEKRPIVKYLGPANRWVPMYDAWGMPERGFDVQTSLNVHLQDITEQALRKQLETHQATYGCAIVMEVETGQIKAIANLSRLKDGGYDEVFNNAVGTRSEPGSTQKIATLMALLEEKQVSLDETVDIGDGVIKIFGETLRDSGGKPENNILTLRQVIEKSSNVGMVKFVMKYFGNVSGGDRAFTNKFSDFLLNQKTGVDVDGEKEPFVRIPNTSGWSGLSLPWLSIGYESELTPLQTLAFFNAIANKGKYMRPYLVTDIYDNNEKYGSVEPEMIKQICSPETASLITEVLVSVVNNGTAQNIKLSNVQLAGKTGTTKVDEKVENGGYKKLYQASFAGFFPAENPKYSCIVVVSQPTGDSYYGNIVAAPVFKEIAEHFYLNRQTPTISLQETTDSLSKADPDCKTALVSDLEYVLQQTGIGFNNLSNSEWAVVQKNEQGLQFHNRDLLQGNIVPNVRGMGLKDAIYILETYGLEVEFVASGKVVAQSLSPGTRFKPGDVIKITLQ